MVILVKIVKIDQLQMHSGFFCLKHSVTIAEQKKTPYERFPMAAILLKNAQVTIAKWSQDMLSLDGFKPKKNFFPQNHIEILVPINLDHFSNNKSQN